MQPITVYHNESCSKSNAAIMLLQEQGVVFTIRNYIEQPLTVQELQLLLAKLQMLPIDIVRTSEPLYKENWEGKELAGDEWLQILSANPILLERPIIETDDKAIIARPPERIMEFLD